MSGAWARAGATVARSLGKEWKVDWRRKKAFLETGDTLLKNGEESDYKALHLFFKANISVEIPEAERK